MLKSNLDKSIRISQNIDEFLDTPAMKSYRKAVNSLAQRDEDLFITLIANSQNKTIDPEPLILTILEENKTSDFDKLFYALRPLIVDYLRKGLPLENILELCNSKYKDSKSLIAQLGVKDLIALLFESCSFEVGSRIGRALINQNYPLPIGFPTDNGYFFNVSSAGEYLHNNKKPLIISMGTYFTIQKGKSQLINSIFDLKVPSKYADSKNIIHKSSIDLHLNLKSCNSKYLLADVHHQSDLPDFIKAIQVLRNLSILTIIHISEENIQKKPTKDLQRLFDSFMNKIVIPERGKYVLLFRDYDSAKHDKMIAETSALLQRSNSQSFLGIIPIPNLSNETDLDIKVQPIKERIMSILEGLVENSYNFDIRRASDLHEVKEYTDVEMNQVYEFWRINYSNKLEKLFEKIPVESNRAVAREYCFPLTQTYLDLIAKENLYRSLPDQSNRQGREAAEAIVALKTKLKQLSSSVVFQQFEKVTLGSNIDELLSYHKGLKNWRESLLKPKYEILFKKYCDKFVEKSHAKKSLIEEEVTRLESNMQDIGIYFDDFYEEMSVAYYLSRTNYVNFEKFRDIVVYNIMQGSAIQLIDRPTLQLGNPFLEHIFFDFLPEITNNLYVISFIGEQNLPRAWFRKYMFPTEDSFLARRMRCGLYFSLAKTPQNKYIVIIEIEPTRDPNFDICLNIAALTVSNAVIMEIDRGYTTEISHLLEQWTSCSEKFSIPNKKPIFFMAFTDVLPTRLKEKETTLNSYRSKVSELAAHITGMSIFNPENIYFFPSRDYLGDSSELKQEQTEYYESHLLTHTLILINLLIKFLFRSHC